MAGVLREQFIGQAGVLDEQAPSPAAVALMTGVQAGPQVGSVTASGAASVSITGVAAAAGVTPPLASGAASAAVSGVQANPAAGNIVASNLTPGRVPQYHCMTIMRLSFATCITALGPDSINLKQELA